MESFTELSAEIQEKLKKSNLKWQLVEYEDDYDPEIELFCIKCGKPSGFYSFNQIKLSDLQELCCCSDCMVEYIKPVPYEFEGGIVIWDNGDMVTMRRKDDRYEFTTVDKQCYFNTKGRFIKIGGKRYHV